MNENADLEVSVNPDYGTGVRIVLATPFEAGVAYRSPA
jgi:hypothetical protein